VDRSDPPKVLDGDLGKLRAQSTIQVHIGETCEQPPCTRIVFPDIRSLRLNNLEKIPSARINLTWRSNVAKKIAVFSMK
jgi:hypothetical protein